MTETMTTNTAPRSKFTTRMLVEGALMVALAAVLSLITPFHRIFPFGGSVTLLSMLPICLYSIKYGVKYGLGVAFVYSLLQLAEGIFLEGLFSWGLTPVMLIACILLDYIIAYTVLGTAGVFRRKGLPGQIGGILLSLFCRFVSHFISGVVVFASAGKIWDELDFVADNKYIYSAAYNGGYMLPEMVFTAVGAVILLGQPQLRKLFAPVDDK